MPGWWPQSAATSEKYCRTSLFIWCFLELALRYDTAPVAAACVTRIPAAGTFTEFPQSRRGGAVPGMKVVLPASRHVL
ncbi:hypothetical protein KL86DPRO_11558 [uncultured delta proteobacterium]|uniref:Uncharacterized protein n=1 Tax=uncultured delta proteobacterium TaxID=34034 RepID=A0A212JIP1_9DELT|nr:hypothetical protein KL86DPRO_11558 [uncultured delta proteobacterium]